MERELDINPFASNSIYPPRYLDIPDVHSAANGVSSIDENRNGNAFFRPIDSVHEARTLHRLPPVSVLMNHKYRNSVTFPTIPELCCADDKMATYPPSFGYPLDSWIDLTAMGNTCLPSNSAKNSGTLKTSPGIDSGIEHDMEDVSVEKVPVKRRKCSMVVKSREVNAFFDLLGKFTPLDYKCGCFVL